MSRPWMPLYVADYLADTAHLSAAESGAYLHLIMHYWQKGRLPIDDQLLARVARLNDQEWIKAKPVLSEFFYGEWRHKRIDEELARAADVSAKRSAASAARKSKSLSIDEQVTSKSSSIDDTRAYVPQSQDTSSLRSDDVPPSAAADAALDPETELFRRGKDVLGRKAGGQITKLLQHFDRSVPKARAAIEIASTKENPSEYIAAVLQGRMARAGPSEKRNSVFAAGQELMQEYHERNS